MSRKLIGLIFALLLSTGVYSQVQCQWPVPEWQVVDSPESVGMSASKIDEYVKWLSSKAGGEPFGTIVIHHGKIACEYYGSGATADSKWEIGSLRKAVGSSLLGIAIEQGKLDLEQDVYQAWPEIYSQTNQEKDKKIKVKHLFSSCSGWKTRDLPGTKWEYNNAAFTASGMVVGRAYNMPSDQIAPLAKKMIAAKIGADDWDCYHYDERFSIHSGNPGPKLAVDSNMRDLARFGYLWLRKGQWNGEQIVPESYIKEASQNQVAKLGKHYGYCWFVNDGKVLLPNAPEDAFFHPGNGKKGRRTVLIIIPSLDLVAAVGTHTSKYNVTDGYKKEPVPHINEWIGKVLAGIQNTQTDEKPNQSCEDYYFPPAGSGLDKQAQRTADELGLNRSIMPQINQYLLEHPYGSGIHPRWALWRNGYLVHIEGDFHKTVDVKSLRKTWHAMIVGAAIKQGRIPSYNQKINKWLPNLKGNDAQATWRHVITQSAGFDYPYGDYPDYKPGQMWTYSDLNLINLCNALARVYDRKDFYDDYEKVAKTAYFDAIGMEGWSTLIRHDETFGQDDGIRFVFSLENMGRLGLLALARGSWNGVELVPKRFVEELETKQTYGMRVNYNGPNDGRVDLTAEKFPECPYGYLTWVNTDKDFFPGADSKWAWAYGAGGTIILWNHNNGIVFAGVGIKLLPGSHGIANIIEENIVASVENSQTDKKPVSFNTKKVGGKADLTPKVVANGSFPDIAVDSLGNIHLVYARDGSLCYKKFNAAAALWSAEMFPGNIRIISAYNIGVVRSDPDVVVDSKGNPHIFAGSEYAYYNGDNWVNVRPLSRDIRDTELAIDGSGNVYFIHRGGNNGGYIGLLKRTPEATVWTALVDPDINNLGRNDHVYGDIAISPVDNTIYVVQRHAEPLNVTCNISTDGGRTWTHEGISDNEPEGPHVVVDFASNVFVTLGDGIVFRRTSCDQWATEGRVVSAEKRMQPELAVDQENAIYCGCWGGKYNIRVAGKWLGERTLPKITNKKQIGFVEIAGLDDFAYVAWEEGNSGNSAEGLSGEPVIIVGRLLHNGTIRGLKCTKT